MNTLVIYDSQYGNTKRVAEVVAKELHAKLLNVANVDHEAIEEADMVVIGSPTQAWHATKGAKDVIDQLAMKCTEDVKVAVFDTGFDRWYAGSAAKSMAKALKKAGHTLAIEPKHFIVLGTEGPLADNAFIEAKDWAKQIKEKTKCN